MRIKRGNIPSFSLSIGGNSENGKNCSWVVADRSASSLSNFPRHRHPYNKIYNIKSPPTFLWKGFTFLSSGLTTINSTEQIFSHMNTNPLTQVRWLLEMRQGHLD